MEEMVNKRRKLVNRIISILVSLIITVDTVVQAGGEEILTESALTYDDLGEIEEFPVEIDEEQIPGDESACLEEETESVYETLPVPKDDKDGIIIEDEEDKDKELLFSNSDQSFAEEVPYVYAIVPPKGNPSKTDGEILVDSDITKQFAAPGREAVAFTIKMTGEGCIPCNARVYCLQKEGFSKAVLYVRDESGNFHETPFVYGKDEAGEYATVPVAGNVNTYVLTTLREEQQETELIAQTDAHETEEALTEETRIGETEGPEEIPETEGNTETSSEAETEADTEETEAEEETSEPETEAVTESMHCAETEEGTEEITEVETEPFTEREKENRFFSYKGNDYTVTLDITDAGNLPDNAFVEVRELKEDTEEYAMYLQTAQEMIDVNGVCALPASQARFFDITIMAYDEDRNPYKIEPDSSVHVNITYDDPVPAEGKESLNILHFAENEADTQKLDISSVSKNEEDGQINGVTFTSGSFSVFGVIDTTLHETTLASNGTGYTVTAVYDNTSLIPANADLSVTEITDADSTYEGYKAQAEALLGIEAGASPYTRLFDISIMDKNGEKMQPASESPVSIEINLSDMNMEAETSIVHFGKGPEYVASIKEDDVIRFSAESFSVYAIVDAPEIDLEDYGWVRINSLEELSAYKDEGLRIGHISGYFLTDGITQINATRTGITKTGPTSVSAADEAAMYYFLPKEGASDTFYVYCETEEGQRRYVKQSANSLLFTDTLEDATGFKVSMFSGQSQVFRLQGSDNYCWNMQGGANGKSFAAYANLNDANAKLGIWYYVDMDDDPFELDGTSYGIAFLDEAITAAGMNNEAYSSGNKDRLRAMQMRLRPDIIQQEGILTLSGENDLPEWTFENISDNIYRIKTVIDGSEKYLSIKQTGVCLTDDISDATTRIAITSGSGENTGKYMFASNQGMLSYSGTVSGGFTNAGAPGSHTWMNLVKQDENLTEDDFTTYKAYKVNASDPVNVADGKQVILYTSIWNPDELKYEYYVVDHNGALLKCYESGDTISWVGSQINTAIWNFTEYFDDNGNPTYYYELQNAYSGKYIAPQFNNGQVLSDSKIGVNLNGRRYGDDYTSIIAWDEKYYSYAGVKAEGTHLEAGALSETQDFYFAVLDKKESAPLTTVDTVDNTLYGISMKMTNWNNTNSENNREYTQGAVLGLNTNAAGLLQPTLASNGYPLTDASVTGEAQASLYDLFQDAYGVNHLFIQNTYNENGYFEYDSTQNFSHLNEDTHEFTVYDQIAAIGTSGGGTRTHGQFMPFNEIHEGVFSTQTNQTNVLGYPLSDLDPRKGEKLYLIPQNAADYFFGMEMEANFVQTASGLDAWGHDIIFEFSGDDDFWLYVDGQLILDLGGIHSASVGKINFRTGNVHMILRNMNETIASRSYDTTLHTLFEQNYRKIHPSASEQEVADYLDGIFELNEDGNYVFKDFTSHNMKMFYMERGGGASNLHMRFNLASAKPGTVTLGKTVSGTNKPDFLKAEFPYQIFYEVEEGGVIVEKQLTQLDRHGKYTVTRKGKSIPIRYRRSYTPAGTQAEYNDVFFLKSGEQAEISLPEETIRYRIVECAVNGSIYDEVTINGAESEGVPTGFENRSDHSTAYDTIENRRSVNYTNHVNNSALRKLTVTKELYEADGTTRITDDGQTFSFRLYLGNENEETISTAYMHEYYVKNEDMQYCRWDETEEAFVPLGTTYFDELSPQDLEKATFVTSPNGSISRIPSGYSIEVQDLIVGTKFKVEERSEEIPAGYSLIGYSRMDASYIVEPGSSVNEGTIRDNSDPSLLIKNKRGWGITAKKEWSDSSFTVSHADIYLAVFVNGVMLPGSLRTMESGTYSEYWYFDGLEEGASFSDYKVMEVTVNGEEVTPIGENTTTVVDALPKGETQFSQFAYMVNYDRGEPSGTAHNVRTDLISNNRDGIRIVKTDFGGRPLAGATFVILDENDEPVGDETYTSRASGYVTTAYLPDGTYKVRETTSPSGYAALPSDLQLTIEEGEVDVSGGSDLNGMYALSKNGNVYTLTLKNKPFILKAVKKDNDGEALLGAHFSLYRQIIGTSGTPRKDYYALEGYEDMVSGQDGLIHGHLEELKPGTYYLCETSVPEAFAPPVSDICFTVGTNGSVSISESEWASMTSTETDGTLTYTLTAVNERVIKKIRFRKVDFNRPEERYLEGAVFDVYRVRNGIREDTPLYQDVESGEDGLLLFGDETVLLMEKGSYVLVEKNSPRGYHEKEMDVTVSITEERVSYDEGTVFSSSGSGVSYDEDTEVYTLIISNKRIELIPPTLVKSGLSFMSYWLLLMVTALTYLFTRARNRRKGKSR